MWWKALVSKDFRKNRTGTTGYLFNGFKVSGFRIGIYN
jgi:sRNA-binding regulator protein Hfq